MVKKTPNLCRACYDREKKAGHYISPDCDVPGAKTKDCKFHPTLTNTRLIRTLATLYYWGHKKPEGWSDNRATTPITRGAGWVAVRSAFCILFDYEKAFLPLLSEHGYLEGQDVKRFVDNVLPQCVRVTPKGEAFLAEWAEKNKETPIGKNILTDILTEVTA